MTGLYALPNVEEVNSSTTETHLPIEHIKKSKDRINALKNAFQYKTVQSPSEEFIREEFENRPKARRKSMDDEDEKDTCEKSDSESLGGEIRTNLVLSRIANYEGPFFDTKKTSQQTSVLKSRTLDPSFFRGENAPLPRGIRANNSIYGELPFFTKEDKSMKYSDKSSKCDENHLVNKPINPYLTYSTKQTEKDNDGSFICRISNNEDGESSVTENTYNIIFGNKDVLKLLSNKHLANLNIKVEKTPDDNKWRESRPTTYISSKQGVRTSFRSSKRRRKPYYRRQNKPNEEKGMSDSTFKENDSDSNDDMKGHSCNESNYSMKSPCQESPYMTSEYIKKRLPEYAKGNKKSYAPAERDIPPRSLSTSPIERAPVVKKISSLGTRLKKETEATLAVNPVKKVNSFRGSRTKRRNSITYFPKKINNEEKLEDTFEKSQVVRLRRRNSRVNRMPESRISVTITPSTVASLAEKFNTMIFEHQNQKNSQSIETCFGTVYKGKDGPRCYSSPRASFKRKYRHKAAKPSKELKGESSKQGRNGSETPSSKRSLNSSLSELNMKDLFDDCDYNKTDEEKVCERIKTALSSGKFKGETDDSEDDLSIRKTEESEPATPIINNDASEKFEFKDILDQAVELDKSKIKVEHNESVPEENAANDETNEESAISKLDKLIQDENEQVDKYSDATLERKHSIAEEIDQDNNSIYSERDMKAAECKAEEAEVCSISSDVKTKKDDPYSSLKAAIKNTVKRTKEKDASKRNNTERNHRSPSRERGKWYKRSRSKERKADKKEEEEDGSKKKKGKLYEKWKFKRFREKSQDRSKEKVSKDTGVEKGKNKSAETDTKSKDSDNYSDYSKGSYIIQKFTSRSGEKKSKKNNPKMDDCKQKFDELALKNIPTDEVKEMTETVEVPENDDRLYGTLSPSSSKIIPPPPKTPIPSPPLSPKKEKKQENVYENLYSPNLERFHKTRMKLEKRGIKPNSSFLWNEAAQAVAIPKVNPTEPLLEADFSDDSTISYEKVGSPTEENQSTDPTTKTHTYTLIQNNSSENSQLGYDEIGPPLSCTYDDIASPPSIISYDSIKSPSESYDPVSPPDTVLKENESVMAHLALVKDNLSDSVSYDDTYNGSQSSHSYEPICTADNVKSEAVSPSSAPLVPKRTISQNERKNRSSLLPRKVEIMSSDESEQGIHEVFSYEITNIDTATQNAASQNRNRESASTGTGSGKMDELYHTRNNLATKYSTVDSDMKCRRKRKEKLQRKFCHESVDEADDWTDVYDEEEMMQYILSLLEKSLVSVPKRKRFSTQKWTNRVRSVNKPTRKKMANAPSRAFQPLYQTTGRISKVLRTENVEEEEGSATGHYEAIYEVISGHQTPQEDNDDDFSADEAHDDDDHFSYQDDGNDSFDSDDSDTAYSRLHPRNSSLQDSTLRTDSFSSDMSSEQAGRVRTKYGKNQSVHKIAEAANEGMKKLRRNWSLTKNEVRTGLNKIKKKSTFGVSDTKSTENLYEGFYCNEAEKAKWSLKNRFLKKSNSSATLVSLMSKEISSPPTQDQLSKKERYTFYLPLSLPPPENTSDSSLRYLKGEYEECRSTSSSVSSIATTTSYELPTSGAKRKSTSATPTGSMSLKSCVGPQRPKTAPPAPPPAEKEDRSDNEVSRDISKDQLAMKLNQLLLSGPTFPPGRKVLKSSSQSSSSEVTSPLPIVLPSEDKSRGLTHSSSFKSFSSSSPFSLSPDVCNLPKNRSSIASSSSHSYSEGYIRSSDIASQPPPLPARPDGISKRHLQPLTPPGGGQNTPSYIVVNNRDSIIEQESHYMSAHFADEPLYQFYTAKVERAALLQEDSSEDDYEVINDGITKPQDTNQVRPTAMELVTPSDGRRTLWCELPEVLSSGILNKISNQERKLQEAMFEVITSEASYLKSLDVLISHFMNCSEFNRDEDPVITVRERKVLFSDIIPVKKASEVFLSDLEQRWQESFEINSITDIIHRHATSSMVIYVKYCSNQIYQERMLRNLKENNPRFVEILNRLESAPVCQSLAMHSFLMLPMQRITRLPLLLDAIFNRLEYGSLQWQECKVAFAAITKLVAECNEGARKMERMEEMLLVSRQLEFKDVKAVPLISASRWLVKKGELTRLTWRENDAKLTFGRKISKHSLYFFLFSDLLVVTKKRGDDMHTVLDFCPRNMVQVLELESSEKFPGRILDGHKNLIIMTMLQNHENKTVEMVLSCPRESDRTRWIQAVTPRTSDNPDERIYEEWDCPQVQVVYSYSAAQPDELCLEVSDVINVLKKTSDGWYQGERLRDGDRGWFPGNHTVEIGSAHIRARNLRQRYRLLAISGSFVEELKKEKERIEKEEKKKERKKTTTLKDVL